MTCLTDVKVYNNKKLQYTNELSAAGNPIVVTYNSNKWDELNIYLPHQVYHRNSTLYVTYMCQDKEIVCSACKALESDQIALLIL